MTTFTKIEIGGYILAALAIIGFIISGVWYYENNKKYTAQTGPYILFSISLVVIIISLVMIEFY